jgi:hypothetical protein
MRHKTVDVSTAKPEQGSLELTEDMIRVRAYQFYEERGCEDGHELPSRGAPVGCRCSLAVSAVSSFVPV